MDEKKGFREREMCIEREKIAGYSILFKKKKVACKSKRFLDYRMLVSKGNAIVSYNLVVFPIKVLKLKQISQRMQKPFKKVTCWLEKLRNVVL